MPERAVGLGFVVEDRLGGAGEVVVSGRWPACQMSIHAQVSKKVPVGATLRAVASLGRRAATLGVRCLPPFALLGRVRVLVCWAPAKE